MLLILFMCSAACKEHRPPVPSAEQATQLNDAEEMLNAAHNEEGPEHRPGPSNPSD